MRKHPTTYYLQSKVIYSMLLISVVALVIMGFRSNSQVKCSGTNFSYRTPNKQDAAYIREPVYFSASVQNASEWQWDFGDKSPVDKTSGPFVEHEYKQPGQYTIRLTVNGECQEAKTIHINLRESIGQKLVMRTYWPAQTLYAGREYYFADSTTGAYNWSWYFNDEPRRSKQVVAYQFLDPGTHRVTLVVNDDVINNKIERVFNVLPAPAAGSPNVARPRNLYQNMQRPTGGGPAIQDDPSSKPLTDYIGADPNAGVNKALVLSDNQLRIDVLNINGEGYNDIRRYLRNSSFANTTIIFNNRPLTIDQLRANIREFSKWGESLEVKQESDGSNYIKAIDIKAKLKSKSKVLMFGGKERSFPY